MNKQESWTPARIIYAVLMSGLLLGYLAVIATYKDYTATGQDFVFPGFVWPLRVISAVMAIVLGKLWKDKGFWILMAYLLLKIVRVAVSGPQNLFEYTVSDNLMTGFWVFTACYGMARVFSRKQLKQVLNVNVSIWTLGMVISSCLGIYAAWRGTPIYTIGKGAVWGITWRNRLFFTFFPTVSGSVASFSAMLALCSAIVAKHKGIKALFLLSMIPMFVALCLTDSRCAQVTISAGIAMMAGVFILRGLREHARIRNRNSWYAWAAAVVSMGVIFVALVLLCMKTISGFNHVKAEGLLIPRAFAEGTGVKKIVSNRGYTGDNVLTSRPMIWKSAIYVIKNNPAYLLYGTSVLNPMTEVNTSPIMTFRASHCHCMPLMILLENGIPGLLLIGAFMIRAAFASFRLVLKTKTKQEVVVVPLIVSVLLGELIECFLWLRTGTCPTLAFFFVAIGILLTTGQKQKTEDVTVTQ